MHRDSGGHLLRIQCRHVFVRPHRDCAQQRLHVLPSDALRGKLLRLHVPIQYGDGQHIRQAVVGVFLGRHVMLRPVLAAAGNVVGDFKRFQLHSLTSPAANGWAS